MGNNITPELDMWQVVQETILESLGRLQRQYLAVYSIISVVLKMLDHELHGIE